MRKTKSNELRAEYRREDLGQGVRGKHLKAYREGIKHILLSPDVARAFPSSAAVNKAHHSQISAAKKSSDPARRGSQRAKARG